MQHQKVWLTQESRRHVPEVWLTGQKLTPATSAQFPLQSGLQELLEIHQKYMLWVTTEISNCLSSIPPLRLEG